MEPGWEARVLDHGYVRLVSSMGTDETIVEAARISTGRGFVSWEPYDRCKRCEQVVIQGDTVIENNCIPGTDGGNLRSDHVWQVFPRGDLGILEFLYKNKHATPFEMCELHIEVMAPIFVFREWHRHRMQSYSEVSARYTPLPDLNYVPTVERLLMNSKTNKQAGAVDGAKELTELEARTFQTMLSISYHHAEDIYQAALLAGVPKELARVHLPVGRYSKMRAKTDLRNWLAFLTLRMAPNAQWEIREYANAIAKVIECLWPRTYSLFKETNPAL